MFAFLKQAAGDFTHTGAVLPSSRFLAKQMTASLHAKEEPRRILEVGPGTGPFTKAILSTLRQGDDFHVVEINPAFCAHIEQTILQPYRIQHPDHDVQLHESPIQEANLEPGFDHIICGLPFNNFPLELVELIFETMLGLLRPGGDLTYFEYAGLRRLKTPFVSRRERHRLSGISLVFANLASKFSGSRKLVLSNVPPAFAIRLIKA